MAFVYIKVPFEMHWHCDMAGYLWESPLIVPAANLSQLSMLLRVLRKDFQFTDNEIRDTTAAQKSVPMFV